MSVCVFCDCFSSAICHFLQGTLSLSLWLISVELCFGFLGLEISTANAVMNKNKGVRIFCISQTTYLLLHKQKIPICFFR